MSEPVPVVSCALKLSSAQYKVLRQLGNIASIMVFKKDDGTVDRSITYPSQTVDNRVFKMLRREKLICGKRYKDFGPVRFFHITDKGRAALEEYKPPKKRRRTK